MTMKKNAGPAAISVAAVVLVGLLVVMYRFFFPPMPPPDTANPDTMPAYAKNFLKNRKDGTAPNGSGGGSMPPAGGSMPAPGGPPGR
jgi:hypothetical protein